MTLELVAMPVTDAEAAAAELWDRGVVVCSPFPTGPPGRADGLDPERQDDGTSATIEDPDGNGWLLQEVGHGG